MGGSTPLPVGQSETRFRAYVLSYGPYATRRILALACVAYNKGRGGTRRERRPHGERALGADGGQVPNAQLLQLRQLHLHSGVPAQCSAK